MAKSNDDELLRMAMRQAKAEIEKKRMEKLMDLKSQSWNSYNPGGGKINAGWQTVFPDDESLLAKAPMTRKRIRLGPFTETEYHSIVHNKEGGSHTYWDVEKNLSSKTDYYLVIEGVVEASEKPKTAKQLGDFQEGYDKGYEDGKKP